MTDRIKHSTPHNYQAAYNQTLSSMFLRMAKIMLSCIPDWIRTKMDWLKGWARPVKQITNNVWQLGQRLDKSAYHAAFDKIEGSYPGKIAVSCCIADLETNLPNTAQSIKDTIDLAFQTDDDFVQQCTDRPILAVPVRISGGNHIGLLVFDKSVGKAMWYDSRLSNPKTEMVMNSNLTIEELANHIWEKVPNRGEFEELPIDLYTNTSKDQTDFYNCGVHVIDCVEWLAKQNTPDIFRMVDYKAQPKDINAKRIEIGRNIYTVSTRTRALGDQVIGPDKPSSPPFTDDSFDVDE